MGGLSRLGIVYISIIIMLNIVGIGYGSWQSDIKLESIIATGNIDPVFSQYEITDNNCDQKLGDTKIEISEDKKMMTIAISDAYPDYSATITYTVTNQGSIPVYCEIDSKSAEQVTIKVVKEPEGIINGYGDSREGVINIIVKEIKEKESYDSAICLRFRQYNMLD